MTAKCDCGASWTDFVSVLIAAAAFVVAVVTLWITALRRPRVEVDRLHDDGRLGSGMLDTEGRPAVPNISVHVFVANTGATGTVVTRFDVTDFQEHNAGPRLWSDGTAVDIPLEQPVTMSLGRDDATNFPITVRLGNEPVPMDEFARRLRTLESVSVTIRWEWRRAKLPDMRRREIAAGSQVVTISADQFRADLVSQWRTKPQLAHWDPEWVRLADIAEGREPDA